MVVIIHPLFEECQKYTLDSFWKELMKECAANKFPKGCRFDGESNSLVISSNTRGKKADIVVIPTDPESAFYTVINIFKNRLGLYSALDLRIRHDKIKEIQSQNLIDLDCEWKKLKPRFIKADLLNRYIITLSEKYNLDIRRSKKLYNTVQIGFQLKMLDQDDVEYEDRVIKNINGLEFDEEKNEFHITNPIKVGTKSEKVTTTQKFTQSVEKYIRDYRSNLITV